MSPHISQLSFTIFQDLSRFSLFIGYLTFNQLLRLLLDGRPVTSHTEGVTMRVAHAILSRTQGLGVGSRELWPTELNQLPDLRAWFVFSLRAIRVTYLWALRMIYYFMEQSKRSKFIHTKDNVQRYELIG